MTFRLLVPALSLLVPTLALAQGVELNTITRVEVNGSTIEITGSKKPNFTTFTMTDPARLVIDISEAVFSGVPDEMQIGNGIVTAIKTASYGSDASAIARVLIGFEREVETDIQSSGNKLVVRVVGGGGQAVAQATPPADTSAADAEAERRKQQEAAEAEAERQRQAQAQAQAQADAEAERRREEEAAAAAEKERQAQAQAAAERQRQADAAAEAERQRQAQAAAEAERQRQAEAEAERQRQQEAAERQRQAASEAERERLAAAEAERQRQAAADAERRRQQEAAAERERQERAARAQAAADEDTRRQQQQTDAAERRRQQKEEAEAKAEARRQQQEEARAEAQRRQQEQAESRRQQVAMNSRSAPSGGDTGGQLSVSSRRKTMTLVGFQQQQGSSRVVVRTNEPVRYSVNKGGEKSVVVELENTQIDLHNNTRWLDTSYFDTAVAMIDPEQGPRRTVRIEIKLKESVPYQTSQAGNELYIDFERPARR